MRPPGSSAGSCAPTSRRGCTTRAADERRQLLPLSETTDGTGAGADMVFGVVLGTGVGGGIVVNGQCLKGPNGIAGEWGHSPLPWADADDKLAPAGYCGRRDWTETYLSGPGKAADHRHHAAAFLVS